MNAEGWLALLTEVGRGSLAWFWAPLLVWTGVATIALVALSRIRRVHPLTGYRLRQALLFSLPTLLIVYPWVPQVIVAPGPQSSFSGYGLRGFTEGTPAVPASAESVLALVAQGTDVLGLVLGIALALVVVLAVVSLAGLLRQLGRLRRITVLSDRIEDPRATAILSELVAQMGIRRPVVLLESSRESVPMTFHWAASWISIPRELCEAPQKLRIALAHELIHVRRADAAWSVVERVVSVPFGFHPIVRILGKSIGHFREASCDAELVGSGAVQPQTYAQLLLDMSRGPRPNPSPAPALFTRKSNLKHRLELMKAFVDTPLSPGLRVRSIVAASVLFLLAVGSAACGINISSDAESSDASVPDLISDITSQFGPMEDETRDAALARLDIQMEYLQERIDGLGAELRAAEQARAPLGNHIYQQYELLSSMYMQRMETYETLRLEQETARRLGDSGE